MIKKLYKKGLSALLTLSLLFSFLPVMPAQAANSYAVDELKFGQIINVGDTISKGTNGYKISDIVYHENEDPSGGREAIKNPVDPYTVRSFWGIEEWMVLKPRLSNNEYLVEFYPAPQKKYTVTVDGGSTKEAEYAVGEIVTITADNKLDGSQFVNWSSTNTEVTFKDPKAATTTFEMPASPVDITANFTTPPVTKYTVTVKGGKAEEAEYAAGDVVNIKANPPVKGYDFVYWEADKDDVKFEHFMEAETSFIMPARDVSLEAVFEPIPTYKVTVKGGRTGDGQDQYAYGDQVPIIAEVPDGSQFDKWTANVGGIVFEDASAATTTFGMPMGPVTITAIFKPAPVPPVTKYPVTVEGGKADKGTYAPGEDVKITAEDRDGGQFVNWSTDNKDVDFANAKAATTTFKMPASAVNITANFKTAPVPPTAEYTVIVTNDGNGTAKAAPAKAQAGTKITLSATPKSGYHFKEWKVEKGGVTIAKDNTFTMPAGDVTVKAVFEKTTTNPVTGLPMSGGETGAFALITLSVLLLGTTVLKRKTDH